MIRSLELTLRAGNQWDAIAKSMFFACLFVCPLPPVAHLLFFPLLLDIFYLHYICYPLSGLPYRNPFIPSPLPQRVFPQPSTQSCLPTLAFLYTRAQNPFRSKVHSSHWCPIRPSLATCVARAMGPSMCTHCLVVHHSGASGVWVVDTVATPWGHKHLQLLLSLLQLLHQRLCIQSNGWQASTSVFVRLWQSLSGNSPIRFLSASISWLPQ